MAKTLENFLHEYDPLHINKGAGAQVFSRDLDPKCKVFIITAAQNATGVEPNFWACLKTAEKHRSAELLVTPVRYKNPTSTWSGSQRNEQVWAHEVAPHLWNVRLKLNSNLVLLADVPLGITRQNPLSGKDGFAHAASSIVGATKLQLRMVPVPAGKTPKLMTTTGAVTLPNYGSSDAGKLGEFHHSLSAVLVELDGNKFYLRQLTYDKKSRTVTDGRRRETYHANGKVTKSPGAMALSMGDTHWGFVDPKVELETWGNPSGIVAETEPANVIWSDLFDALSCNPHDVKDPFIAYGKLMAKKNFMAREIAGCVAYLRERAAWYPKVKHIIQAANHNDMLRRRMVTAHWQDDLPNAKFILDVQRRMLNGTKMTPIGVSYPDPFEMLFNDAKIPNVRVLKSHEGFKTGSWEHSLHGDDGPNGARGSTANLRRLGVKVAKGHDHSPAINEGATSSGTSTRLRASYTGPVSSWMNAHTLIQHDDQRQLLFMIDGKSRI